MLFLLTLMRSQRDGVIKWRGDGDMEMRAQPRV